MGSIKDLPGVGSRFSANLGPGSFKKKLYSVTRYDLKNLSPHQQAILSAVKKYEGVIRLGGLSSSQIRTAYNQIKDSEKGLSLNDKKDIKSILEKLKRGAAIAKDKALKTVPMSSQALDTPETEYQPFSKKTATELLKNDPKLKHLKAKLNPYKEHETQSFAQPLIEKNKFAKDISPSGGATLTKPASGVVGIGGLNKK